MANYPTYAYEGDQILAFDGSSVIAHGTEFAKVAETADEYFSELRSAREKKAQKQATHITTPNGEQGTILGRTASVWSDEITVRLDNGEIRHYATYAGDGLKYSAGDNIGPQNPIEDLQARVDLMPDPTREGLTARLNDLGEIRQSAGNLITAGVSYADQQKLNQIALAAVAEGREVKDALAHLRAVDEAIEAPVRAYAAVEQASMGHSGAGDWLEIVAQEMIAESEAEDYDKLLVEGPTAFVGSLDNAVVAHTGITRELAEQFILSKTAGFQGEAVENYREQFVAATEMARRRESSYRAEVAREETTQKEASVADTPDEALYL